METREDRSTGAQPFEECINSGVQEKVFKYLLDDIEDEREADAAEEHLLECRYCRETFLTMLHVRVEANGMQGLRENRVEPVTADAQLLESAGLKEQDGEERHPGLRAKSARGQSK